MSNNLGSTDALAATPSPGKRQPVTDSPWYWIYLFCTAGLIALLLAGPKYARRQAQIERNHEDRLRAAQQVWTKDAPATATGTLGDEVRKETRIPLWPLYVVLIGILGAAWINLWRTHWQHRPGLSTNSITPAGPS